jgi:hypothetical protein
MEIAWYNKVRDATLTASEATTGYPATNLQHPFRGKQWRATDSANVVVDHGSAKSMSCAALVGYDWSTAPSTLDLEFNTSDSWASPAHTESLTWTSNPSDRGWPAVIFKTFTEQTYQYVRLNVGFSGAWGLGVLWLGTYWTPSRSRVAGGERIRLQDPSMVGRAFGGQRHVDVRDRYRMWTFELALSKTADWPTFLEVMEAVGIHDDFVVQFSSDRGDETLYGALTGLPDVGLIGPDNYGATMTLEEAR